MNNIFSKYFAIFLIFGFCFTAYTNLRAEALLERKVSFPLGPYKMVTFYPDVDDKYSFYYLPLPPHLSLLDYGELKNVPHFQFLKYNFDTRSEGLTQGGVIQMAISVSLPIELYAEAQKKLATAYGVKQSEKIKIGMIDIPQASIQLYTAQGNIVKGKGSNFVPKYLGSGPSIRNAGDIAPFVIEVTPEGSAVYEKMLEGTAGLGINYSYDYQGTTPYIDVEVTGTWDKIYAHASSSSQFKAKVSSWFFWSPGVNYESNRQSLKDDIFDNTDVKIKWNIKPPVSPEGDKLRALIENNILMKIMEKVFSIESPKSDEQAVKEASAQDANGWFGGFSSTINTKDVTRRKTGNIHFSYLGRERIVSKNNPSGNFISLKPENEKMKAIMFAEVERDKFFNAVEILTSARGIDPSKQGISGLKYTVFCGDTSYEKSYEQDVKGKILLPVGQSAESDDLLSPIYCANPRGKYAVTYQADLSYVDGRRIKSISSERIPLAANGNQVISYIQNGAQWGITLIEIDARNFLFGEEAKDLAEQQQNKINDQEDGKVSDAADLINPKDYPKYITGKVSHGTESLRFKIDSESKNDGVFVRFKRDDKPIKVEMEARGYNVTPKTRNYVSKGVADWEARDDGYLLILDNEDFK